MTAILSPRRSLTVRAILPALGITSLGQENAMSPKKPRAAIYARKSTKDDARDAEKSVARQEQLAREFAASKGWTVTDVYVDNVSGQHSKKLVQRGRLMADAAEGKFDVVIVRDSDRLSRDDKEVDPIVVLAGFDVTVWEYTKDAEVNVGDATNRLVRSIHRFKGSKEAEDASARTREQKFVKARLAGEHGIADGKVLGYKNVGEHKHRRRVIDPEQAKLVTRIFEMSAAGMGYLKIATTLNRERVKNPNGQDRGDTTKRNSEWSVSGIKAILERELYRGKIVYGRKRNVHTDGGRKKVAGDKVVTVHRPDLAIIPESLWTAAHERKDAARRQYLRSTGGQLYGKPFAGVEGKHLLSGLLECGLCGGNMFLSRKSGKRSRPQTMFACSNRRAGRGAPDGGPCHHVHGVPEADLVNAVLGDVQRVFLDPERLGELYRETLERRRHEPDTIRAQRKEQARLVARLEGEVERLAEAIAEGGQLKVLVTKLADREAELRDARARLEHLDGLQAEAEPFDVVEWLEETKEILGNLRDALETDQQAGRAALKHLLATPIVVTPGEPLDGQPTWTYSFKCSWAGALLELGATGNGAKNNEFSGTVARRASTWCPRGDSNTRHAV
jgi:site-specific DNA recombinase